MFLWYVVYESELCMFCKMNCKDMKNDYMYVLSIGKVV